MRRLVLIGLCAALMLVVAACGDSGPKAVPDDAVAVVGDQTITKEQWNALIAQTKRNFVATKRAFPKPGTVDLANLKTNATQFLIQGSEYQQEADKLGVKVTDADVDARLDQIKKQYYGNPAGQKQATKAEMEKAKAELTRDASSDRDERKEGGFPFHAYELQRSYETSGQSDRLLSLESSIYSFTGGAHGSTGSGSLIWDRQAAKEVSIPDLLNAGQSWTGAITQAFCVLLNREREKRRGAPVEPGSTFGDCPKYNELTKVLRDTNGDGRFDHVGVIADQYVAGPYAEGDFDIPLPITATMVERIKPEFRSSFEARPGVK